MRQEILISECLSSLRRPLGKGTLRQVLGRITAAGLLPRGHHPSQLSASAEIQKLHLSAVLLCSCPPGGGLELPFSWNSVIRGFERRGLPLESLSLYRQMVRVGVLPDKFTYPFALKACATAGGMAEGEQVHCRVAKSPCAADMFVRCHLIDMYGKLGRVEAARRMFDNLPHRNVFCWNVMIDGYVKNGLIEVARELFNAMPVRDVFSWNAMIDGYSKCGLIEDARALFDVMPVKDTISWNSVIDGYARCGDMEAARELFYDMPQKDGVTWGIMLNTYVSCGHVGTAHSLFEKLPAHGNSVMCNSLICGYARNGDTASACKLFNLMPCRNLTSWNIMLDAYMKDGNAESASSLFDNMLVRNVFSWNIMIDGYARARRMDSARGMFDLMPCRDVISWNTLITGYKQIGQPEKVFELFYHMLSEGQDPDCTTLVIVISTVTDLNLLDEGRRLHAYIIRHNLRVEGTIAIALVDMYSKCGRVRTAFEIFNRLNSRRRDHWNAMISGVAAHGDGGLAISLFEQMEGSMITPDAITFVAILNACSHTGLLEEGHRLFQLMSSKYHIAPNIHHVGCMVDLLSRAGHLELAMRLVKNMHLAPNEAVWRALLGASKNYGNMDFAEHSAKHIIESNPNDSSSYILLSHMYGSICQHKHSAEIWKVMKDRGVIKNPGFSSIEPSG